MFRIIQFFGIDSLWKWVRPTLEGDDGKASARRLSIYIIMVLFILGNIQAFYIIQDKDLVFDVLLLDVVFILILFGIVTIQNVITLFKIHKNQDSEK